MDDFVANTSDVTLHSSGPADPTINLASPDRPIAALAVLHQAPDAHNASGAPLPALAEQLNEAGVPLLHLEINEHPSNAGTPALDLLMLERSATEHPHEHERINANRPGWLDGVNANVAELLPRDNSPEGIRDALLKVLAHGAVADVEGLMRRFDRLAQGNTVMAAPEPIGMVNVEGGVQAAAQAVIARQAFLNPYLGAQQSLLAASRKLAAAGMSTDSIACSLSVGVEAQTTQGWQLAEMRLGLRDAARALGLEVSAHGECRDRGEHPAPTVWTLAKAAPEFQPVGCGFRYPGDAIILLGATEEELSGSLWELALHDNHLGGMPPHVRLEAEQALSTVLRTAAEQGTLSSAAALTDGGLGAALATSAFRHGEGFAITMPSGDPTVNLFSESSARALVSLAGPDVPAFEALCADKGVPSVRLGEVTGEGALEFVGLCSIDLQEARSAWQARNT